MFMEAPARHKGRIASRRNYSGCKDDTPSGSRARGWPSSQRGCVCVTCYVMSMRSPESEVICLIR